MLRISPLQMTDATSWSGLTTTNHLGAIFQQSPQKASDIMSRIHQMNFGQDLDTYLNQFPIKYLEDDRDYTWELMGAARKNVPLIEARINGTAIVATDQPGLNDTLFELVFPEAWFTDVNMIVGHQNEKYILQIKDDPQAEGNNWVYTVALVSNAPTDFMPFDELSAGTRFSVEYSAVEDFLSEKGGGIQFTSPFTMRNALNAFRLQHPVAGNMKQRKVGTQLPGMKKGEQFKVWTEYEDYIFDMQYRLEKNRFMFFGKSNRRADGSYSTIGKSGNVIKMGSGLREQMEASNTQYYSTFTINFLVDVLLDLSINKLPGDQRKFLMCTGERGAIQFHNALEGHAQLFQPLTDTTRMYGVSSPLNSMAYGYGGQFVEFRAPNGVEIALKVMPEFYDDLERNKVPHPDGGVAESYRYDIWDIGTTDGEPNIQKLMVNDAEVWGYEAGLRHPFSPNGEKTLMSHSKDAYTIHRGCMGFGCMVKDPSKSASLISSVQQ